MDWIKDVLPDDSQTLWLIIICIALAMLNVYQYARAHDLAGTVKLLLEHGHAPEGKVIVPAVDVARAIDERPNGLWRPPGTPKDGMWRPPKAPPHPPSTAQPAIPPLPYESKS